MKITGIIAEYNPFHNGHLYQIQKAKQETGCDYLIVVLSGDFVQRGTPAMLDKYTRTHMALANGASLVIELPALWATASAEYFAAAGVTLLDRLGVTDHICFGAECPDSKLLGQIAELLLTEPWDYRSRLNECLKQGMTFPAARASAVTAQLAADGVSDAVCPAAANLLASPNNILALEYCKELIRRHSSIRPAPIRRTGGGYHDTEISALASATAIRRVLSPYFWHSTDTKQELPQDTAKLLLSAMPANACELLLHYAGQFPLLDEAAFSSMLRYRLLLEKGNGYARFADCTPELSNRLHAALSSYQSFPELISRLKTKEVTQSRLSRMLLHILLGITNEDYLLGRQLDYIPYLRVLGFRQSAAPLLHAIKQSSELPLLTKMADADTVLHKKYPADSFAHRMLSLDIFAADVYTAVMADHSGSAVKNEYTHGLIRLP